MGNSVPQFIINGEVPQPLRAVSSVALEHYAGVWFQVAAFPSAFQSEGAHNTTATYTLRQDIYGQYMIVRNSEVLADGSTRFVDGRLTADGSVASAAPTHDGLPGYFLVEFQATPTVPYVQSGPIRYWVIELAADYRYSVVSEPSRRSLWILARETTLPKADWDAITHALIERHGFSRQKVTKCLIRTPHDAQIKPEDFEL